MKKTITICDRCRNVIESGKDHPGINLYNFGALLLRKDESISPELDLCEECAESFVSWICIEE